MIAVPTASASAVLAQWSWLAVQASAPRVIPDGCRDVIVRRPRGGGDTWFITEVSHGTYRASLREGDAMVGLRLQPGAIVEVTALGRWAKTHNPVGLFADDRIDEFCVLPASIAEALNGLRAGLPTIALVANELGVSPRTLQREVGKHTGKSPHFWLALARVRRTCRALPAFERLADAAAEFGFADQAHMTREVVRWFGVTPGSIKAAADLLDQLQQPGYG